MSRDLADAGARSVLGVDPSARMLELAEVRTTRTAEPRVRFLQAFAEELHLPAGSVDLVVSSLVLHYIEDLPGLLANVASWPRPHGVFVASMEHPTVTASGGRVCEHGCVLNDYAEEGVRRTTWFIEGVVKYHRTTGTIIRASTPTGSTSSCSRRL